MTTIVNKTPEDVIAAYRANKPKNKTTNLFLIKNGADIPIFGFHIIATQIFVIKEDSTEVSVEISDIIELRK